MLRTCSACLWHSNRSHRNSDVVPAAPLRLCGQDPYVRRLRPAWRHLSDWDGLFHPVYLGSRTHLLPELRALLPRRPLPAAWQPARTAASADDGSGAFAESIVMHGLHSAFFFFRAFTLNHIGEPMNPKLSRI